MPSATIYRMVLPDHECPWGRRALGLLEDNDFAVEEHQLTSRDEVDAFKAEHGVSTTPLVWVEGEKIGGCTDLEKYLASGV